MGQDLIRYDVLAQEALRGVIRKVLSEVAKTGLPGEHHFFITFLTSAPGVRISSRLREKYPELMTIVVQHQFWDLQVTEASFEVGLSFSDIPERLLVPFSAIRGFYDPAVNFELEFDVQGAVAANAESEPQEPAPAPTPLSTTQIPGPSARKGKDAAKAEKAGGDGEVDEADRKDAEVVSLDAFRKKT
ncbi:SspB family protein [Jiella avicenniae]|uniref:SspB family protein n=1 Tax=Jiella avicenniae TaxID=2907202 RepID=A0A9X1TAR0_9HYPH|nr:SspB family protein [Jiella avicenniae]MCE7027433.1 SspB family protein [Jiella avicenniae]